MKKNLFFAGIGLVNSCFSVSAAPQPEKILDNAFAGSWYDADPVRLRGQIQQWFKAAESPGKAVSGSPLAVIVPHAGYVYSGSTAAYAFKLLQGKKIDRIILLGPSHRAHLPNQLCIPAADGFRTPLGTLSADCQALELLKKHSFVRVDDRIHYYEHSLQIQFPFLQCAVSGPFKIVPVIAGQMDRAAVRRAAEALSGCLTPSTLLVVSSDFTHYGRSFDYVPFRENIAENLRKLDLGAFERIQSGDAEKFTRYIEETGATICGEVPIRILLEMLPRGASVQLLHYSNSAAENQDYSHCVSYVAGIVSGTWQPSEKASGQIELPKQERLALLKMARDSIAYVFRHRKATPETCFSDRATEAISRKMGCFVTLKLGEDLRGCIGEIEPFRPLYQAVTARAVDSAFRDPRFQQLTPAEFRQVEIEISALTPARPVKSWREIEIGRHGMTISKDGRSAVFLPQVAPEQGWDLETTLTHLSRKAGLPADAWKSPDARFTVFEAIVFRESDYRKSESGNSK